MPVAEDALARAVAHQEVIALARVDLAGRVLERNREVVAAVAGGCTRRHVADSLGVTRAQVRHILQGRSGGHSAPRREPDPPREFDL